jgi:transaldolase
LGGAHLKLFLDSANLEHIKQASSMGFISGVTTNPSLAAKENVGLMGDYKSLILEIASIVDGPISVEVTAPDFQGMIDQSYDIAKWHKNVIVKLPSTIDGFKAMSNVAQQGIPINQTLCFSVNQAILGAQSGVTYVSTFVGRLDDGGHDGMNVVADIVDIFGFYDISTKVLAASIRSTLHCLTAAKAGADVATVPFDILMQMAHHPLTDAGALKFLEDWKNVEKPKK